MEFRLLEYFVTVSRELHFTKAAEKLGISQPTLSQQIRLLEDRLGTPLFRRFGKKIHITQAGKILLDHCERIFFELEQADSKIKEVRNLLRGKLSIGSSGNHLVTSAVISFHAQYPGIELSIEDFSTNETIDGLLQNELDIGVIFLTEHNQKLKNIPLFKEELLLVVSVNHELANLSSIELEKLDLYPLTLLPKKYMIRQQIDENCRKAGFTIQPKIELSTTESLLQMVKSNHQLATILPKSYLTTINDTLVHQVSIMNPTPQKEVSIVYRDDVYLDSTMNAFINQLIQTYKK